MYKIRVGTEFKEKSEVLHEVEYIKAHDNYTVIDLIPINDVAIIRVKTPFEFNEKCQKIELVGTSEELEAGATSVTSGWGFTENVALSDQLRSVTMPAYDRTSCNEIYPGVVPEGIRKASFALERTEWKTKVDVEAILVDL